MTLETVTPPEQTEPQTGSLADHEAEFNQRRGQKSVPGPVPQDVEADRAAQAEAELEAREPGQRFKEQANGKPPRHRARSAQASAEDVPRIKTLTAKLRTAEQERDAIKARVAELEAKANQPAQPTHAPASSTSAAEFDEKEPDPNAYAKDPKYGADPYSAYLRDLARYDRRKEAWEQGRTQSAEAVKADAKRKYDAYTAKARTFAETHADFLPSLAKIDQMFDWKTAPVFATAIVEHDNGPELVYHLAQHPDLLSEVFLVADGKPVTPQTIAAVQRFITSRVQAATGTGAVAAPERRPAPRPPTPVRTGPLTTGDEPPDDGSSLAAHEAFYAKRRRR